MANILYIQLISKSEADKTLDWETGLFPYCLASGNGEHFAVLQQGLHSLADLKNQAQAAQQVVLLFAATDVTTTKLKVPPMSGAKLKLALPSLLEEQLLADPNELILNASTPVNEHTDVTMVSRPWAEKVLKACSVLNARKIAAVASSQVLHGEIESTNVFISGQEQLELAIKYPDRTSMGIALHSSHEEIDSDKNCQQIVDALQVLAPTGKLQVFLDKAHQAKLEVGLSHKWAGLREVNFRESDWKSRLYSLNLATQNLLTSFLHEGDATFNWQRWRWSILLISLIGITSIAALQWQWWKLRVEARNLTQSKVNLFKVNFPREALVREPIVQMQLKINSSKKLAGLASNDDFVVLTGQFGQAWDQITPPQATASIVNVDYRDRSLFITPKNANEPVLPRLIDLLKPWRLRAEAKENMIKISVDLGETK